MPGLFGIVSMRPIANTGQRRIIRRKAPPLHGDRREFVRDAERPGRKLDNGKAIAIVEAIFLLHLYLQLKQRIDDIKWIAVSTDSIDKFPYLCRDDHAFQKGKKNKGALYREHLKG
jgi:hypothetical protein